MMSPLIMAKIEILDRVAIIVDEGVVLESQVNSMMQDIKKRYSNQSAALPPDEVLLEQVHERLIIQELQLQMAERAGIRVSDTELNASLETTPITSKGLPIPGFKILLFTFQLSANHSNNETCLKH